MSALILNEVDAGRYLGGDGDPIQPRTLQRWRQEGKGPAFLKIGYVVRYRQQDLDEFLNQNLRTSTSEAAA